MVFNQGLAPGSSYREPQLPWLCQGLGKGGHRSVWPSLESSQY